MISKIVHFERYANLQDIDYDFLRDSLCRHYQKEYKQNLTIRDNGANGTLGIVFGVEIEGVPYFAKTHKPSEFHKANLDKEFFLLKEIYGDKLFLDKITVGINEMNFSILIMDELEPNRIDESFVARLKFVQELGGKINQNNLDTCRFKNLLGFDFNFENLYKKVFPCLQFLFVKKLISEQQNRQLIQLFEEYRLLKHSEEVLCHGDLSNKNILRKGDELIVVDWEDAISGSPKYDLCYWLTFMDQRKYYDTSIFRELIKNDREVLFFMSLVLVLKSYLSVLDGSIHCNKVSVRERIEEIFDYT